MTSEAKQLKNFLEAHSKFEISNTALACIEFCAKEVKVSTPEPYTAKELYVINREGDNYWQIFFDLHPNVGNGGNFRPRMWYGPIDTVKGLKAIFKQLNLQIDE